LEEADAEENSGKVKAVVPESEDDIEIDEAIDDDDDDSTFIADEEEEDEDVTDIIGDVSGDEET
ncbi:TIGR02300 family protein, partial [Rhodopseudomonas sp. BR0C11]